MSTSAQRRAPRSDLTARIIAAIPAIIFAIVIVYEGGLVFTIGIALLGLACLHELFTLFARAHPSRLAGSIGLVAMLVAAHYAGRGGLLAALVGSVPLAFGLILLQPRGGAPGLSVTFMGLAWIGLAFGHAVLLRDLPHGDAILVDVLVGTFLGDTGAYLGGRAVGRRKLAPSISPNKTVEGLLIGLVVGTAAVWFAGLYQDWLSGTDAILLGLAIVVAAPIGDLFESYLKRDAGTKDTGRLFGPHGGALDRLDAVMFTVVVGYYVWRALL